jgi:hypothetical protein
MHMKNIKKIVVLAAVAALTVTSLALGAWTIKGRLAAGEKKVYTLDARRGWVTVEVEGFGSGDLDAYIYDEDGYLLDKDELQDNYPLLEAEIDYSQTVTIVITNASDYCPSGYEGLVTN